MSQYDGRLIFPGGRDELKPFTKEMKKLRSKWVADTRWKYRSLKMSPYRWAAVADEIVDVLIATDTETTMALILGLAHANDEAYALALEAAQIMRQHGAAFYQPGSDGTRDPMSFVTESQEYLEKRREAFARTYDLADSAGSLESDSDSQPDAAVAHDDSPVNGDEGEASEGRGDQETETGVDDEGDKQSEESSIVEQLERLASLFKQGLITDTEYKKLKAKLLDK